MHSFFKKTLGTLLITAAISACTDSNEQLLSQQRPLATEIMPEVTVPDTAASINHEKAIEIAKRFICKDPQSRSTTKDVDDCQIITDTDGTPQFFVVNFTGNNGFVILSAKTSYFPIVAESDNGRFDIDKIDSSHPASVWISEQQFNIKHTDQLADSLKETIASLWLTYNNHREPFAGNDGSRADTPDKPQVFYDSLRRWTQDPNIEVFRYEDYINTDEYKNLSALEKQAITRGIETLGNCNYGTAQSSSLVLRRTTTKQTSTQLMTTTWEQDNGYNASIPGLYPAGCAIIAVAQIMKYHKFPTTLNWSSMPDNYPTKTTADFLYQLGLKMGVTYDNPLETPANGQQIRNGLTHYKYTISYQEHVTSDVITEVNKNKRPILQLGTTEGEKSGHAWVCDGVRQISGRVDLQVMTLEYRPTTYSTPTLMIEAFKKNISSGTYSNLLHFNWGWGGLYDSYFIDNPITINGKKSYNSNRYDGFITH